MNREEIEKILKEADNSLSNLTDKELNRNSDLKNSDHYQNIGKVIGLRAKEEKFGIFENEETRKEWSRMGGISSIKNMNEKNKQNNHWKKVSEKLKGVVRDVETKKKIKEGTSHSWRAILQFTKDGKFLREWKNFTDIEEVLSLELNKRIIKQPIWSVCNNKPKCKTAYGFIWKYKDEITSDTTNN